MARPPLTSASLRGDGARSGKAQAPAASPAEPSVCVAQPAQKRARNHIQHEQSIQCWRVRLSDGTCKGFSYRKSGTSEEKEQKAKLWLAAQQAAAGGVSTEAVSLVE